ncbi:hypothetical protein GCM10023184_15370 [Flaviaesturariibacter amylovorans]|uniref:Erythromycin esterase family protein n=2 Tax=Flaviaesturariibacter amylovorans TaxID=1084520 RepID=A0ABP8GM82_9BACT
MAVLLLFGCRKEPAATALPSSLPSYPLRSSTDLDTLLAAIGDTRIVMLGESTHGTSEYYRWRTAISQRLIAEKGFDAIAVEGEWADSWRVNQFISGPRRDSAAAVTLLQQYDRWPTWMWGNYEVASLVTWLNAFNQGRAEKAGFYGLDVYGIWESLQELRPLLPASDSLQQYAEAARRCFQPFSADPIGYASAVANSSADCRAQVERLHRAAERRYGSATARSDTAFLIQQNALVAYNAERYYTAAASNSALSWNIRDGHMLETLGRLLDRYGPASKIIVWAHNTHVGDARYTDMAASGTVNLGQLAREAFGPENVFLVGFGSYSGSVIAADAWGAPYRSMAMPRARRGSWEELLHSQGTGDRILLSRDLRNAGLDKPIGHRAVGVTYNPASENGNYVPTVIPMRYDAFLYFDHTRPLTPIPVRRRNEPPDTYPSGF